MAVLFFAGCAGGGSSPPSESQPNATLPALSSRAAATSTAASLSRCSVTATAQGVGGGNTIIQADPISANDMWFAELMRGGILDVARYNVSGPPSGVLQPFSTTPVFYAYMAAFADNDIWAVANLQTGVPPFLIAHWNGSAWRKVSMSGPNTSYFYPQGFSGLSTNDLWISGTIASGGTGHMAIAHWNGTTFSVVAVSPYGNSAGPLVEISPTEVWTTAYDRSNVYAVSWNGSHFGFNMLPPAPGQSNAGTTPVQISATGPDNVWIVAQHATRNTIDGRIWRYNGNWQPYLYTPATGDFATFEGVAPLDATRTVITSGGQSFSQGTITYGYSGTIRFHSIPNNLPEVLTGKDSIVPGTSTFWVPATLSNGNAGVDLVNCN